MRPKRPRLSTSAKADLATRAENLRLLGFDSYRAYLKSDLWQSIRARVLVRDAGQCRFCPTPKPATQVHHGNYFYLSMSGESIEYLYAICGNCHERGSLTKRGALLSSRRATRKMQKRAKRRRAPEEHVRAAH